MTDGRAVAAIALTGLALGGCGERDAPESPAAPELRQGGALPIGCDPVPPRLVGSYFMRTERAELPPELAGAATGANLLLLGAGQHAFMRVGDEDGRHLWPVCVRRDGLRLPAESAGPCAGRGDALYRWTLRGEELTLERLRDGCLERFYAATAHSYVRFNSSGWRCEDVTRCERKLRQAERFERTGDCASLGCG